MSWCSTSRGGPTPARVTRTATPAIGMVSVTQLPAVVLTMALAPDQTTRFPRGLARRKPLRDDDRRHPCRPDGGGGHGAARGFPPAGRFGSTVIVIPWERSHS